MSLRERLRESKERREAARFQRELERSKIQSAERKERQNIRLDVKQQRTKDAWGARKAQIRKEEEWRATPRAEKARHYLKQGVRTYKTVRHGAHTAANTYNSFQKDLNAMGGFFSTQPRRRKTRKPRQQTINIKISGAGSTQKKKKSTRKRKSQKLGVWGL